MAVNPTALEFKSCLSVQLWLPIYKYFRFWRPFSVVGRHRWKGTHLLFPEVPSLSIDGADMPQFWEVFIKTLMVNFNSEKC